MKYSADWFTGNIPYWETHLAEFMNRPFVNVLEIGCFEGMSTVWLLENVLVHETSKITVIDPFKQTEAYKKLSESIFTHDYKTTFLENIDPYREKVEVVEDLSFPALVKMYPEYKNVFDIVYVDGDHDARACMADMVLSWELLKPNGIMIVDDYEWIVNAPETKKPHFGVDGFLLGYTDQYRIESKRYQVILRKLS